MSVTSQQIVELFDVKLVGQQLLIPDPDYVLLCSKFQPTGDDNLDREILIHWWMHVYDPTEDYKLGEGIYGSWSNACYRYFKYATQSGYNPETGQAVKLSCYKHTPLEPQLEQLQLWLPHIKPSRLRPHDESERKGKWISVFEHTLSYHGSYNLIIYSDTEVDLTFTYDSPRKFGSLDEAVDFVRLHHWYEKRE